MNTESDQERTVGVKYMDTEDKNATSNFAAQLAKIKSNMVTTTSSKVSSQNNQQKNNLTVNIIVN